MTILRTSVVIVRRWRVDREYGLAYRYQARVLSVLRLRQHAARNDDFLHLRGSFIDAQGANLAIQTLDNVTLAHAVTAEQLHCLVDYLLGTVGGEEFGHGSLAGNTFGTLILGPGSPVDQEGGGIHIEGHFGQLALHQLQVGQAGTEQFAAVGAGKRLIQGATGETQGGGTHGGTKYVEDRKSTRLNSSHVAISYAVFCLKKKKKA